MKNVLYKISLLTATIAIATTTLAQFGTDFMRAADAYFAKGDYRSAAEYYEKALGSKPGKKQKGNYEPYVVQQVTLKKNILTSGQQQAIFNLGECYRHLNWHVKAEPYYKAATDFDATKFPLAKYWYGKTLKLLGKFEEAGNVLSDFTNIYTENDLYKKDAQRELQNLQFIQTQLKRKDLDLFKVNKVTGEVNPGGANYAPVWVNKQTLAFTSTRSIENAPKNQQYTNRIYTANYSDGVFSGIKKLELTQPVGEHQAAISFTPDGNTAFLTRSAVAGGEAALYMSTYSNGVWADPVKLNEAINFPGSSSKQPCVTPDGKYLLFSSNRNGGFGGYDLWYASLSSDGISAVNNMGATINTEYDEQAPAYHAASNRLLFSSNGRIGMGGYDFFASKGTIGNFSVPENLGYPINSVKDELYIASSGPANNLLGDVYFSSDRESECCLELFNLTKIRPLKQIAGTIADCKDGGPLAGVNVTVTNAEGTVVHTQTTGADGRYSFTLEDFMPLTVKASLSGYHENGLAIAVPADMESIVLQASALCLNKIEEPLPPKVDTVIVLSNVYFEFNKDKFKLESTAALDEVVAYMNKYPNMEVEISGHTDNLGDDDFNMDLSQRRAQSCVNYILEKGIAKERIVAIGYGETKPVEPNQLSNGRDNPDGRAKNRRIEFKVLGYNYNK
jgi:OmpA-OmpF porin, OOP family